MKINFKTNSQIHENLYYLSFSHTLVFLRLLHVLFLPDSLFMSLQLLDDGVTEMQE